MGFTMNFTKVQGAGNDFVLVETSNVDRDWSPLAIAICDRHFGVGADGLLLLLPSDTANFQMRVFNPDGSEAKACGNGLRCLIKYVVDRKLVNTGTQEILVETMSGVRKARLHYNAKLEQQNSKGRLNSGEPVTIQVSMGQPEFGAEDIPVAIGQDKGERWSRGSLKGLRPFKTYTSPSPFKGEGDKGGEVDIKSMLSYPVTIGGKELLLDLISMGNPHAVYFWQHPVSDFPLSQLGPKVEQLAIFPNGVNFEVARVVSREQIEVRVWERGVGETLACGSGACAVAVAAQRHGYIDNKVDIKLPGGILNVEWGGVGEVFLNGPAEIVFSGEWPD